MRIVLQRVRSASVSAGGQTVGRIGRGFVILLGVGARDSEEDAAYLARKVTDLRVFADSDGKMNVSAREAGAGILVVSQFTLYGDCRKGRRPSFDEAAPPELGRALYEKFMEFLRAQGFEVQAGVFGAMMDVELVNDGPVTLILESTV